MFNGYCLLISFLVVIFLVARTYTSFSLPGLPAGILKVKNIIPHEERRQSTYLTWARKWMKFTEVFYTWLVWRQTYGYLPTSQL